MRLRVSPTHELEIYESGKRGQPAIVFLHGGPGTGVSPQQSSLFDPSRFHAILFDQRGCGKSTPRLSLESNTTWDLVADIEMLRKHFGYESWYVVGGSWGSTLALAYATRYPQAVKGALIWATTQYQPDEIIEMCRVFPLFYPDAWATYVRSGGTPKFQDIPTFEYAEMTCGSPDRAAASLERSRILWSCGLTLDESLQIQGEMAPTTMLFFFHYCVNHGFFTRDTLPTNLGKTLAGKPFHILHGRQDMRCFVRSAYQVHEAIAGSQLRILPAASHGAADASMRAAIEETLRKMTEKG